MVSRWGEHGPPPAARPENNDLFGSLELSVSLEMACSPEEAWQLVSDVTRIGEFSPECIDARWIDGAAGPAKGARFEGTNRVVSDAGDAEVIWIRPCTVTTAEPPGRFAYTVGDRYDGSPATEWEVLIEPTEMGCRITQRFHHLPGGLSGLRQQADSDPARAAQIVADRADGLRQGMTQTLAAMKDVLERGRSR